VVHEAGGSVLPIAIGQVPLALHFSDAELRRRAGERYFSFESSSPQSFPIFLTSAGRDTRKPAQFEFALRSSKLRMGDDSAEFAGVANEYVLDSLLRILLSLKLLPEQGFLIHAATVERAGKSYVFMGRSGAGKSTVAAAAARSGGIPLTDEISLVRKLNGTWHANGTPFWGEFRAGGRNCSLPLAGIYALVQAPRDSVRPMDAREALRELLPNVLFFSKQREHREALLQVTSEIAATAPFFRLEFTRDVTFWEAIAA
jgi:hypothetical protein